MSGVSRERPDGERRVDLVFEGGGVKGVALVGALSVLEERGFVPRRLAGTSSGAIVAALRAAGYTSAELQRILQNLDYNDFLDTGWEDRIPLLGPPLSVLKDLGIYEGEAVQEFVRRLLAAKGIKTFGDLAETEQPAGEPRYGQDYRLQVIASDLTERRLLVLPRDAGALGIEDPGELEVALAVRMSTSIPIFFEPVRFTNPLTGREHLIVDGGILSNFPVWLFDATGEPRWPTFGLKTVDDSRTSLAERLGGPLTAGSPPGVLANYLESLALTVLEARDRVYIDTADFARTIAIPSLGVRITDFDLSPEKARLLYESGRAAAEKFLKGWSFSGYVAAFRRGESASRREVVEEEMRRAAEGSADG